MPNIDLLHFFPWWRTYKQYNFHYFFALLNFGILKLSSRLTVLACNNWYHDKLQLTVVLWLVRFRVGIRRVSEAGWVFYIRPRKQNWKKEYVHVSRYCTYIYSQWARGWLKMALTKQLLCDFSLQKFVAYRHGLLAGCSKGNPGL